jgi:lipopolysaccharide exporter
MTPVTAHNELSDTAPLPRYVPDTDEPAYVPVPEDSDSHTLYSRIRQGVVWSAASTLLLRFANITLTAIVAHILDPRDFGIYAVALTAYAIVASIGQLGVSSCLIRADLDINFLAPTVVTISLITSAILAGAMAIFAAPVATALGSAAGVNAVRTMSIAIMLSGIFAVPCTQLVRDFKLKKQFIANVISFVPTAAALLLLAKSGSGAMAFAWSRVLGEVIEGSVVIASVGKNYLPGFNRRALPVLFKFGLPLAGANFVNYILLNVDYVFVGHLLGAVMLGVYVLAYNVSTWPGSLLGGVLNNVSMPAISRVKHDPERLKRAITDALRAVSLVVMPVCAMTIALSRPLILTLYGSQWGGAAKVLSVLSLYGAISISGVLFGNILAGLGRTRWMLLTQLIWICVLVPAMALGVHMDGIVGAAIAHVVVITAIVLPTYLVAIRRTTGVEMSSLARAIWPALVASAAAGAAAWFASMGFGSALARLIVGLLAGGIVYVLFAAPQVITIAFRGKDANPYAERVLRGYRHGALLIGFPGHARHRGRGADKAAAPTDHTNTQTTGAEQAGPPPREFRARERRQLKLSAVLAVVILAVLGVATYAVASGVGSKPRVPAAAGAVSGPSSPPVSRAPSPTTVSPSPRAAVVAHMLRPAGVTAVGPGGATGDDPGAAGLVIDRGMSTPWETDWYDTAEFGGLQTGTGLLIDMGRTVTVTSVRMTLGPQAGNVLQVRVGDSPGIAGLMTVATEAGVGGTLRLKLASPVRARYVMIWFTGLAPDGSGTYQAKVYNVSVIGRDGLSAVTADRRAVAPG